MEDMQYYQQLIQQGYPPMTAAQYTKQYFPEFQDPILNPSLFISPDANIGEKSSRKSIFIASIMILSLVGIGGFFLYDDAAEPDFYGEVYWTEMGFGYIFEEDGLSLAFPLHEGGCDEYDGFYEGIFKEEFKKSGGICVADMDPDEYSSEDKGDYYKICIDMEGEGEYCIKVYPLERGIVMKIDGKCNILVGDISTPPEDGDDKEGHDDLPKLESWLEDWENIAEEIMDDDDAPSCSGMNNFAAITWNVEIDYLFDVRDAYGDMSDSGGDALVHIMMTQGDDLNWALVSVSIVVNDGASYSCEVADWADADANCMYTIDGEKYWQVSEEITISEGNNTNLCDGSNGGCTVDVTITKIGVGDEDNRIIAEISAYADAN